MKGSAKTLQNHSFCAFKSLDTLRVLDLNSIWGCNEGSQSLDDAAPGTNTLCDDGCVFSQLVLSLFRPCLIDDLMIWWFVSCQWDMIEEEKHLLGPPAASSRRTGQIHQNLALKGFISERHGWLDQKWKDGRLLGGLTLYDLGTLWTRYQKFILVAR